MDTAVINNINRVIINPVNCVGNVDSVNEKQFALEYPEYFKHYLALCKKGVLIPGTIVPYIDNIRNIIIINFPIKIESKHSIKKEYVVDSLLHLKNYINENINIKEIIFQPFECNTNKKMSWLTIKELINSEINPLINNYRKIKLTFNLTTKKSLSFNLVTKKSLS